MSWLNNYVDCVVYLNLDERLDRKERCEATLNEVGITPYYRIPAIKDDIGQRGCALSHYNIIKHAKENKYKNILIFEDDFGINDTTTFKSNLLSTLKQIETHKLNPHMVYLGGTLISNKNQKIDANLFKLGPTKATHSYIIYENLYDVILDRYDNINVYDDRLWSGPHRMFIDVYYAREIHSNNLYNIFGCSPCLTHQTPGYSDIEKRVMDYDHIITEWNDKLK